MAEQNAGPVVVQTGQPNGAEKPAPAIVAPPVVEKPAAPAEDPKAKELREAFERQTGKEREILAARQKLKQDTDAHAAAVAKHAKDISDAAATREKLERAKLDPEGVLKELFGPDWYDHTVALKLDKKAPTDLRVDAVLGEVESLKKKMADKDAADAQAAKDREQESQREQLRVFNSRAVEHVKAAGDKYELTNAFGYQEQVPEVIRLHWQEQVQKYHRGEITEAEMKLLSVDDAAKMVEESCEALAEKAKSSKRLTTKWGSPLVAPRKAPEGKSPEVRSLSNDMTGTGREARPAETDAERRKRAAAAWDAVVAAKQAKSGG